MLPPDPASTRGRWPRSPRSLRRAPRGAHRNILRSLAPAVDQDRDGEVGQGGGRGDRLLAAYCAHAEDDDDGVSRLVGIFDGLAERSRPRVGRRGDCQRDDLEGADVGAVGRTGDPALVGGDPANRRAPPTAGLPSKSSIVSVGPP